MKKVIAGILLLSICLAVNVFAQRAQDYPCTSSSTAQECQDKLNIDTLKIQLLSAQQTLNTISAQLTAALPANIIAQQNQAGLVVANIQNEILGNEADYNAQEANAELTADNATFTAMQPVSANTSLNAVHP